MNAPVRRTTALDTLALFSMVSIVAMSDDDVSLKKVSIVIYKTTFYFVEEEVIDGNKKIEDDQCEGQMNIEDYGL